MQIIMTLGDVFTLISNQPTWLIYLVVGLIITIIFSIIKKFVKLAIYLAVLVILIIVISKLLNLAIIF